MVSVDLQSGMEELRSRLEVLLGARPEAPLDESQQAMRREEAERIARKERMALAGGQLLSAAFGFLGEMLPRPGSTEPAGGVDQLVRERFAECLEKDEKGRPRLTVTLPDEAALDSLARSIQRLLAAPGAAETAPGAA